MKTFNTRKVAAKMLTWEVVVILIFIAPVAIFAASTVGKSTLSGLGAAVGASGISNGLVGWWTFDGPDMISNVADKSGNGNAGQLAGFTSTTTVQGPVGQALSFDGTDDYVALNTNFSIASSLTISLWFQTTYTAGEPLFGQQDNAAVGGNPTAWVPTLSVNTSGQLRGELWNGSVGSITSSQSVADGKWHHALLTGSGSSQSLYLDGSLVGTRSGTIDLSWWVLSEIGASFNGTGINIRSDVGAGGGWEYFRGPIDDVRVYNRVLSADEVKKLYGIGATTHIGVSPTTGLAATTTASGASNGLVGWWTFDGKNMLQNVADASGNGNTGRLVSFTSTTTTEGPVGQALSFDGTGYVSGPTVAALSPTRISFGGWVKTSTVRAEFIVHKIRTVSPFQGWALTINSDGSGGSTDNGQLACWVGSGAWAVAVLGAGTISDSRWHHVYCTYDGTTTRIYFDGVLKNETAQTAVISNVVNLEIGRQAFNATSLVGSIDDVRVYNRALSAAEVQKLYGVGATTHVAATPTTGLAAANSATGASNNLVGWWTFDGKNMLQNAADSSGNGNKGLLASFTSTSTAITEGKLGQALTFDGVDDGINVVSIPELNPYTTSVWFKLNALPGASEWDITSKVGDVRNFGVLNDKLVVWDGTTGKFGATTLRTGVWYHGVVVHTGAQITVYLNGTADGAATASTPAQDGPGAFAIGHQASAARNFNGVLDDLRVYTRALSASEVQRLYDLGR